MKGKIIQLLCCLLFISACFSGCIDTEKDSESEEYSNDVIYQTSTIAALLEGMYEGDVTVGELKQHGDLGLGTFNGLDGEMVVLDGIVYQVKADGVAYRVDDSIKTPFAAVTMFNGDLGETLEQEMNNTELNAYVETLIPSRNLMYAIKIEGNFSYMKTRSVPAQEKPYPRLADITKSQPTFEFENVSGTIVGFWLPDYVEKVNVPGYHLHFLTTDVSAGGHVLEYSIRSGNVSIDISNDFLMQLPATEEFLSGNFSEERTQELTQVEKGTN
ncbi:acetolactate decarboxylase [uncultured Methanomethylovorans sp.]|uniref:acetolactate decarboxylase n=1 Tax=uncultured Methanomethylovorans sp. TaxID=183759 RepID=UPI002AA6D56B|nr:acetolactate decarboxylase [uncultured Methanomethylovorans sp.]